MDPALNPDANGLDVLLWSLYESLMPGKRSPVRGAATAGRFWVSGELDIAERTLDEARARLIKGGWLARGARGAKRTTRHYARRIPRKTEGSCYVDVPGWWAQRAQAARKQADGTTRPASDYVRPDAWWLLVRITETFTTETELLDGGPGCPGVTVTHLAGLIGATSGRTGRRRLAELEAAGLVDVTARPGGRLIVRPVWSPEEAAEVAARYAREGRLSEPRNSRTSAESQGPHQARNEPPTPDRIRESPRTESASHPGQNPRVHKSHLQGSHLQRSHVDLPAVGEAQVVGARASAADAGKNDPIIAKECAPAAPSGPESAKEAPADPVSPDRPLRAVRSDHMAASAAASPRRTPVDRTAVEVFRAVPAPLAALLPEHGARRVLAAIAAELAAGHRSVAELADRVAGRGETWRWRIEDVTDSTALVIGALVRRGYDCPDVRCEDRVNLDTGQDCRACQAIKAEQARTALSATQTPEPPLSGARTSESTRSPATGVPSASTPIPPRYVRQAPPSTPPADESARRALLDQLRAELAATRERSPADRQQHEPAEETP